MRIAWLTDIHLDFLSEAQVRAFGAEVARTEADLAVLTGDISVASVLGRDLARMVSAWRMPCYFVAGNHDYYGAGVEDLRRALRGLPDLEPRLRWLPDQGVVRLSERVSLIGVDGWADGRLGDPEGTQILFNDHIRIRDLVHETRGELLEKVRALGDAEAAALSRLLGEALAGSEHVYVATHVPPFRESATHQGRISPDAFLPWMTCHAVGEVLREAARAHPTRRITVLVGHTHDRTTVAISDNLEVRTGAAAYGAPAIEAVLEL